MEAETLTKVEETTSLPKISLSHSDSTAPTKCSYQKGRTKKPKRNKSAFILFSIGMRAKLKSNVDDQLNSNEMMVKLAELWKNLPKAEREAYYTEARDDKLRYLRELDNFSKNHPSESIHNRTKKNHVKKPCSAYAIFLREKKGIIKEQKPDLKMADILKIVSEQWKSLNEEDRSIYKEKAQEEKETVRIKLGETIDKAKNNASKINLNTATKKLKTQEQSSDPLADLRESSKAQFKIGSTGDLRVKLDNSDIFGRSFDRTFSTMSTMASFRGPDALNKKPFWEEAAPSLSSLLHFQVPELNNNTAKDSELDEEGRSLMKLFDKAVQKSSELLVDLFNFSLPTERFDTLNFNQRPSNKLDLSLLIPQLLFPFEGMNFSSPSSAPSHQDAVNDNLVKSIKKVIQVNSEQKESSTTPDLQLGNVSPPKVN